MNISTNYCPTTHKIHLVYTVYSALAIKWRIRKVWREVAATIHPSSQRTKAEERVEHAPSIQPVSLSLGICQIVDRSIHQ